MVVFDAHGLGLLGSRGWPSQIWQVDASGTHCTTPRLVASIPQGRAAAMAVDEKRRRLYVLSARDRLVQSVWGFDLDVPGSAPVSVINLSTPVVQVEVQMLALDPASGNLLVVATCTDSMAFCVYAAPSGAVSFAQLSSATFADVRSIAFDADQGALALSVYVNGTAALLLVDPNTGCLRSTLALQADEGLTNPGSLVAM